MKNIFLILGLAIGCGVLTGYATNSYLYNQLLQQHERYLRQRQAQREGRSPPGGKTAVNPEERVTLMDTIDRRYNAVMAGGAGAIVGLLLGMFAAHRWGRGNKVLSDS